MTSVDQLIEGVSLWGRYQLLQLVLCFFTALSTSSQTLSIIFTAQTPRFQCDDRQPISAASLDANFTSGCFTNGSCPSLLFSSDMKSVVTKYGLVCDRVHLASLIPTLYMIGFFWGGTIYGYVSDRFGRRLACLCSGLHTLSCAVASSFAPNYLLFVIFRILTALGASGQLSVALTYIAESASSKNRALYMTICQMPWSIGLFFICLISFLLHDQSYIDAICAAFSLSCVAIFFLCYESPRWLVSQGRADEAKTVLEKIAKINKRPIVIDSEEFRELVSSKLATQEIENKKQVSLKDLFVNPGMRRLTLSLWLINCIVRLVYYGFFYGISSLDGMSIYYQVMIGAGIELVINLGLFPFLKYCERLWLRFLLFVVVASFTFVVGVLIANPSMSVVVAVLCSVARPLGGFIFSIEVLYSVEIYPTTHRTLGLGCSNAAARLGSILATQLVPLGLLWRPAPYVLITVGCVLVILLTCFLPESKYNPCPGTIAEAEEIVNRHRFYREQLCCQRRYAMSKNKNIQEAEMEQELRASKDV